MGDIRQICLFKISERWRSVEQRAQGDRVGSSSVAVGYNNWRENEDELFGYSPQWWSYIVRFWKDCAQSGKDYSDFTSECSYQVMESVLKETEASERAAMDALEQIRQCATDNDSRRNLLLAELRNRAWSPMAVALRINGWRYSDPLEGSLVTRSICGGFLKQPPECNEFWSLIEGGGALGGFGGLYGGKPAGSHNGSWWHMGGGVVSFAEALLFLAVLLGLTSLIFSVYKRYLTRSVRQALREEVMLEVRTQMADYAPLDGAPRGNNRFSF